jgi:hypothetical protein
MIEWTSGKILELTSLAQGAATLGAVVMVAYSYFKTRSFVTLLAAALTAGFFLWTIHNPSWWQQRVSEESTLGRPPTRTAHHDVDPPNAGPIVVVVEEVA